MCYKAKNICRELLNQYFLLYQGLFILFNIVNKHDNYRMFIMSVGCNDNDRNRQ